METPVFFLEKRKNKLTGELITTNVPIFMNFNFNGQRLQYYTGLRIDASKWDDGLERTPKGEVTRTRLHHGKAKRNTANSSDINNQLTQLSSKLLHIFNSAKALHLPITPEYLRQELQKDPSREKHKEVFTLIDKFLKEKALSSSKTYIRNLKASYSLFKKSVGRNSLYAPDLTMDVINDFKRYLVNERKNTHNTLIRHLTALKTFILWVQRNDECDLPNKVIRFQLDAPKVPEVVHIHWAELMRLCNLTIKSPTLREVRDFLCFGCFTGQRFSDLYKLKPEHIKDGVWTNFVKKSKKAMPLYIPLTQYALEILERYKDNTTGYCLPRIPIKDFNAHCKEVGKLAKLNRLITKIRYLNGEPIQTTTPFYDIMTSHIMRKTFVSNALHLGMTTTMIREFTGHATEREFKKYLAILKDDKIKAMQTFDLAQAQHQSKKVHRPKKRKK
jgi:integrase